MSVTLYVEGAGKGKSQQTAARKGFKKFFERAELSGGLPAVVACGTREATYDRYVVDVRNVRGKPMLLVDAEAPVKDHDPWQHLHEQDGWERPGGAAGNDCHLMVQVMETWFLADSDVLGDFYGQGFRFAGLPQNNRIEEVSKEDVLAGLDAATRETTKGQYRKGTQSFELLEKIDPKKVTAASPHAQRLIDSLREE